MPTARKTAHRIAKGWITSTALMAGAYLITGLTVASDQGPVEWLPPMHPSETPSLPVRAKTRSGRVKQYGLRKFNFHFSYWTFGMTGVWESAYYDNPEQSSPVTVLTYDRLDVAKYVQCYMAPLQLPGASGEVAVGGWANIIVEFLGGVLIAAP